MALLTYTALLGERSPNGTFIVDTSFILGASAGAQSGAPNRLKSANKLKRHLKENKVGLVYIGVVRNEASHNLREVLFREAMSGGLQKYKNVQKIYKNASGDKLKEVLRAGYVKAFEVALGKGGKKLRDQLDAVFFGCKYISSGEMEPKPSWDEHREIMSEYGLDSSDAMILNFAISQKTFRGLITLDGDFCFCNDVPGFDVVVPDNVLNRPGFKDLD